MARSAIQLQRALSLPEFQLFYGPQDLCKPALEKARWPDGFRSPRCGGHGKHPSDLPQFYWIDTLLGNLKTSLSGTFHALNAYKYASRSLGGYCFRFSRRFSLAAVNERIANAVCCCMPCIERDLRLAEAYGSSRFNPM